MIVFISTSRCTEGEGYSDSSPIGTDVVTALDDTGDMRHHRGWGL